MNELSRNLQTRWIASNSANDAVSLSSQKYAIDYLTGTTRGAHLQIHLFLFCSTITSDCIEIIRGSNLLLKEEHVHASFKYVFFCHILPHFFVHAPIHITYNLQPWKCILNTKWLGKYMRTNRCTCFSKSKEPTLLCSCRGWTKKAVNSWSTIGDYVIPSLGLSEFRAGWNGRQIPLPKV